jgi:low affinity Fe/Cu permease
MNKTYLNIERKFEQLTEFATKILGNSISFLLAFCLVIFWWINDFYLNAQIHQIIGDIIFGTTFLSLFIIQKSFNIYSAHIHLKMNELISSHEPANNAVMDMSQKTEKEIREMTNVYIETDDSLDKELDKALKEINIENQI